MAGSPASPGLDGSLWARRSSAARARQRSGIQGRGGRGGGAQPGSKKAWSARRGPRLPRAAPRPRKRRSASIRRRLRKPPRRLPRTQSHLCSPPAAQPSSWSGSTSFWQQILQSVTSVELPLPGTILRRGEPVAVLHAGGRSLRIEAPLKGMVVRTTPRVASDPALLERDCTARAGCSRPRPPIRATRSSSPAARPRGGLQAKAARLVRFLGEEPSAAFGGPLLATAAAALDEEAFGRLARAFLRAQ